LGAFARRNKPKKRNGTPQQGTNIGELDGEPRRGKRYNLKRGGRKANRDGGGNNANRHRGTKEKREIEVLITAQASKRGREESV